MDVGRYRPVLASSVVFERLGPAEIDSVMAACELVQAKPGQLLLTEGTPGAGVYLVLEGEVEVFLAERTSTGHRRPSRVVLNRLGPGRCFGEYGALDDQPSSASIVARTAATLAFFPKAAFRRLLDQHDVIGRVVYANLLRFLIARLRSKDRDLDVIFVDEKR